MYRRCSTINAELYLRMSQQRLRTLPDKFQYWVQRSPSERPKDRGPPPGSTAPMARQALHTDGRPSDLSDRVLPSARKPSRRAGRAGHHLSAHSTFGSGITKHQRAELDLHPVEGTFQQTSGLKSVPISDGCSPLNVGLVDSTSRPTAALLLVYRGRCLSSRILAFDRCMRNDAFAARNHVARIRGAVVAKESKLCRRSRGNQRRGRGEQFHKRIRRVLAARSTRPIRVQAVRELCRERRLCADQSSLEFSSARRGR